MTKNILFLVLLKLTAVLLIHGQQFTLKDDQKKNIYALIAQYSKARESKDTVLLKKILTTEIDQLVSTGEWRIGINSSVQGMLNSSSANPGTRTLNVERVRLFTQQCAIVDCKYIIQNSDGSPRTMWSTFIAVLDNKIWKISAIRNMLPAGN